MYTSFCPARLMSAAGVVVLCLACRNSAAQSPKIELKLEPFKKEFLQWEYIHFTATITNVGTETIMVPEPSERSGFLFHKILRETANGRELVKETDNLHREPNFIPRLGGMAGRKVTLRPGESASTINRVFCLDEIDLDYFRPGDYVATADYYDGTVNPDPAFLTHRAPEVVLRIKSPSTDEAVELVTFREAAWVSRGSEGPKLLEDVLAKYPTSVFREKGRYVVSSVMWDRQDWQGHVEALRRYREFIVSEPERDISYVGESIGYEKMGDLPGAIRVVEQYDGPMSKKQVIDLKRKLRWRGQKDERNRLAMAKPTSPDSPPSNGAKSIPSEPPATTATSRSSSESAWPYVLCGLALAATVALLKTRRHFRD